MKTKPITRYATIFHNSKTLDIKMEYYKKIVKVHIIDRTKYFPLVDTIKVKRYDTAPWVVAREYAIEKGYF